MHAVSLVTGSLLAHSYASMIADAQRLVNFFWASHQPYSNLKEAAEHRKLTGTLATSNHSKREASLHMHAMWNLSVRCCGPKLSRSFIINEAAPFRLLRLDMQRTNHGFRV